MRRVARAFWIALLAMALPLQGVVAATMSWSAGVPATATAAAAAHQSPHEGHRAERTRHAAGSSVTHAAKHAGMGHHCDEATAQGLVVAPMHDHHAAHDDGHHSCSACGSCCAGTAVPSVAWDVPARQRSVAPPIESVAAVPARAIDGPDRPPRSFLA